MAADPISSATAAVSHIASAIRQAAQAVGTSFAHLLATAKVESNFNPGAKAATSSAQGLFQFIEQTWLSTMKEAGPRLGYGEYADAIVRTPGGRMAVADPAMRAKILNLRHDPAANAAMAGALTNSNASVLRNRLGRAPSDGELYIAHFLGAGGASKLIGAAAKSHSNAAELFPAAASANRSIFYDKQGQARSASDVYANLTSRYNVARAGSAKLAAAKTPDPAGMTQVLAASQPVARRDDSEPVFHALFHTAERQQAVAPRINQLWSPPQHVAATAAAPNPPAPTGRPLDLFQDLRPEVRALFTGES